MDLAAAPFIFVTLFFLASLLLFFVYKFGIKEKSYEEALAEQRQQSHALLGIKPKPKEKKSKKAAKKAKDKAPVENETADEQPDSTEPAPPDHAPKKHHVEFKEETEEVLEPQTISPPKKRVKRDKVRPILVGKDKAGENLIVDGEVAPANHFEELHPKDEFELLRSNSSDELVKPDIVAKPTKAKLSMAEPEPPKQPAKKPAENSPTEPPIAVGLVANTGKEKKKKKSEYNILQQLTGDRSGPNVSALLDLVRKAELSRSEVQILIDLLLNKQHEAPATLDEWSEGKSDPVQKLKKQLAEKEKLLAEEQQALAGAQAKLREIRTEQQTDRSQLQQKIRGFDELLQAKQLEGTRLLQQLQQAQGQLKEQVMKEHKLRDEIAAIQMQRQQFEVRVAQAQEAEAVYAQLQNDNQELSNVNQQLRMELARLSEENVAEKERQQAFMVQLGNYQQDLEQKSEHIRKQEESRLDVERKVENMLQQENELKMEISRLNAAYQKQVEESQIFEQHVQHFQEEIHHLQREKGETAKLLATYKSELQQLKEDQPTISIEDAKAHEVEILNLHNELASTRTQLQEARTHYENKLQDVTSTVDGLKSELEEQKAKNNELRTRNWKVMEALNIAESRTKSISLNKIQVDQEAQKQFVQRLFPEIKELEAISPEHFQAESEKFIKDYFDNLQSVKTEQQERIEHYKSAVDDTEQYLVKLQKQVQEQELDWIKERSALTAELDHLRKVIVPQLEMRVEALEKQLEEAIEERDRVRNEFHEFKSRSVSSNGAAKLQKLSQEMRRLNEELRAMKSKNGDADPNSKAQNCNNSTNGAALIQYSISSSSSIASSLGEASIKKSKNKKKKKKGAVVPQ